MEASWAERVANMAPTWPQVGTQDGGKIRLEPSWSRLESLLEASRAECQLENRSEEHIAGEVRRIMRARHPPKGLQKDPKTSKVAHRR